MFEDYLHRKYYSKLSEIVNSGDSTKHHSINIPFSQLLEEDFALGQLLLNSPDEALTLLQVKLDKVVDEIQAQHLSRDETCDFERVFTSKIHVRVYDLYFCAELNFYKFPKVVEKNYVQISGTVTRICAVKMLRFKRDFMCQKCKEVVTICASYEQKYRIIAPKRCSAEGCNGRQMIEVKEVEPSYCKDYQEIKFQEDLSLIGSGVMPHSMWITLEDDLADICKPGDSITVCGIIKRRWSPLIKGKRIEVSLALQACHVAINNTPDGLAPRAVYDFVDFWREHRRNGSYGELTGRDVILRSFSPEIHGLYLVKLAVAVVLAGGGGGSGNAVDGDEGSTMGRTRNEPHLLLVGDPGTGKSQLLRQAAQIIPRSVCTTGIGSTSAGLTVTAIMEDGEWQLEAGAMVLSDGGICCIDEFHTMREHDRTSIHEAMEQQSISVAKASIVCKLNTRCSILAAANPQSPFDADKPLSSNLALASPLLSRFDLILPLRDRVDEARDLRVADFILSRFSSINLNSSNLNSTAINDVWTMDMLKDYYVEVRKLRPVLSSNVIRILNAYYQYRRRMKFRNEARTTVRLVDSLVRLSKAHAKLMYREMVTVLDAVMAIVLLESGESESVFDPQGEFPDDIAAWYGHIEQVIGDMLQIDLAEATKSEIKDMESKQDKTELSEHNLQEEDNDDINIHQSSIRVVEQEVQDMEGDHFNLDTPIEESKHETSTPALVDFDTSKDMEISDIQGQSQHDLTSLTSTSTSQVDINEVQKETTGKEPVTTVAETPDFSYIFGGFDVNDFDIDV